MGIPKPLSTIRLGESGFYRSHARTFNFRGCEPVIEVDSSCHTHTLGASAKARCDLVKLVALEDLAGGDTIREAPELDQCGSQPLLVGTPPKTLLIYVRRCEEADCLGGDFSVSRSDELVKAINEDVFGRKHERRLTGRKPDLNDFLGRRWKLAGASMKRSCSGSTQCLP